MWRTLLVVYDRLDVRLPGGRFNHVLPPESVDEGVESFERFPALAAELSDGEARVQHEVIRAGRALSSLTEMAPDLYWPSPSDTRRELDRWGPAGRYDSIFAFWPLFDPIRGSTVPSGGWGLALGISEWSNGATYATVGSAQPEVWAVPVSGEVWLHEWLHGVCDLYARRGYLMPPGDADGAERAGYRRDPAEGWCAYYRHLMTGRVALDGGLAGIPPEAWRTGAVHDRGS